MTVIDPQTIKQAQRHVASGTFPSGGVDTVPRNNGDVVLIIFTNGTPTTITVSGFGAPEGAAVEDIDIVCPASGWVLAGTYPPEYFNNADGELEITASATTGVQIGALRWPKG